ncbi:hypothetical protein AB4Y63_04020 [Leifsonia sp. YAF41]|uniref:hypothetical protein n=1 Tax=Leifsonia sp. YAF41 TaxID=3233086 RepID=UPI003F9E1762
MNRSGGGVARPSRVWWFVGAGFIATAVLAAVMVAAPVASLVVVVLFWASIAVGMVVRLVKARPGSRIRSAFGPVMSAAEEYQRLYTTQPGLGISIDYAIREQQENSAETPGGQDR